MDSSIDAVLRIRVVEPTEGTRTIKVCGELDLVNTDQLERLLLDAVRTGDLHLDMRSVTFADSTGLNALVSASLAASALGHRLAITPSSPVRRAIEFTGLSDQLLT